MSISNTYYSNTNFALLHSLHKCTIQICLFYNKSSNFRPLKKHFFTPFVFIFHSRCNFLWHSSSEYNKLINSKLFLIVKCPSLVCRSSSASAGDITSEDTEDLGASVQDAEICLLKSGELTWVHHMQWKLHWMHQFCVTLSMQSQVTDELSEEVS